MFVCRFRWSWLIIMNPRLSRHTDPHLDLELTGQRGKLPRRHPDLGLERVPLSSADVVISLDKGALPRHICDPASLSYTPS